MLYRFREAQAAELGLISRKKEKRPGMASSVNTVGECEKWRRQVLSEISRLVTKIQDGKKTSERESESEREPLTYTCDEFSWIIGLSSARH